MNYINKYLNETKEIIDKINQQDIYKMWKILHNLKGRLFILGVGGGAGNASHAVNDFRKIMGIDAYTPTDNVSEFSARINDDGVESSFIEYLKVSKLNHHDCILVFSVGGGNEKTSYNIVKALKYATTVDSLILGIVGKDGGYTPKVAHVCIIVPIINKNTITPHTEELQSIIWHLLVNYHE
jgi:D-sedoheptulose 7-phosphate isomerase